MPHDLQPAPQPSRRSGRDTQPFTHHHPGPSVGSPLRGAHAAAPIAFWWLNLATVHALAIVFIAAVYIGFAVGDGRPRVIFVETLVAAGFFVLAASAVTATPWLLVTAYLAHGAQGPLAAPPPVRQRHPLVAPLLRRRRLHRRRHHRRPDPLRQPVPPSSTSDVVSRVDSRRRPAWNGAPCSAKCNGRCCHEMGIRRAGHAPASVPARSCSPMSRSRMRCSAGHASCSASRGCAGRVAQRQGDDDHVVQRADDGQELGDQIDRRQHPQPAPSTTSFTRRGTRGSPRKRRAVVTHAGSTPARSFSSPGGNRRASTTSSAHDATRTHDAIPSHLSHATTRR